MEFELDLAQGYIAVPPQKTLRSEGVHSIQAKELPSLIGKILSMSIALGPITRLRTHSMYSPLNSRLTWSDALVVKDETQWELELHSFRAGGATMHGC